jgi:hypothetical protein
MSPDSFVVFNQTPFGLQHLCSCTSHKALSVITRNSTQKDQGLITTTQGYSLHAVSSKAWAMLSIKLEAVSYSLAFITLQMHVMFVLF